MTNIELLEEKIRKSGLKRSFISEKLEITRASLYRKLRGLSEFSLKEVSRLCDLLGITDLVEKEAIFFAKQVD